MPRNLPFISIGLINFYLLFLTYNFILRFKKLIRLTSLQNLLMVHNWMRVLVQPTIHPQRWGELKMCLFWHKSIWISTSTSLACMNAPMDLPNQQKITFDMIFALSLAGNVQQIISKTNDSPQNTVLCPTKKLFPNVREILHWFMRCGYFLRFIFNLSNL